MPRGPTTAAAEGLLEELAEARSTEVEFGSLLAVCAESSPLPPSPSIPAAYITCLSQILRK